MKRYGMIILLLSLVSLLLPACELPRPGGGNADIGNVEPVVATPAAGVTPEPAVSPEVTIPPEAAVSPEAGVSPEAVVSPPAAGASPVPGELSTDIYTAPQEPAAEIVPGTVLMKLTEPAAIQALQAEPGPDNVAVAGVASLDQLLRQIGATELRPVVEEVSVAGGNDVQDFAVGEPEVGQIYAVNFPPGNDPQQVANQLAEDPAVEYAEPNFVAGITGGPGYVPVGLIPNDPYFRYQWNFQSIQMPVAWDTSTGQGVTVAIVDTGVDFRAPDLANIAHPSGYDFANDDSDSTDDQGHGTHVAGTIAQATNNNVGVAGVAFNAQVLPVKVLGSDGLGSYENIIQGIVYAVDQGARVINLSLAGTSGSQALQDAVKYAYDRGVVVVAAAGNRGGPVSYPAAYDDYVIAVGATRYDNTLTSYSNYGPQIDLVAPGGDTSIDQNGDGYADGIVQQTFKTVDSGYTYLFYEGTSMASPHVAGVAALLLSHQSNLTVAEVESIMTQSARNQGEPERYGAGLVQAADALAMIAGPTAATETPTPLPQPITVTPTPLPPPVTLTPTLPPQPVTLTPTPPPPPPVTLTPTPVTPPPGPPAGDLLTNGNFEADGAWVFGDTPIRGSYSTNTIHSGGRAACLGATAGPDLFSYSSAWQKVTIPAEAQNVTLGAYVYPLSQDEKSGGDRQYIMVLNQYFQPIKILADDLSNTQAWEQRTYNLSDLAGRTVYIYFSAFNRGGSNRLSALCVDDVTLTWGTSK